MRESTPACRGCRSRQGSLLGILLALLAVVSLLVFSAQWSARFAAVAVRRETLAVDSFHRAWGLVQLMTSRLKKRLRLDVDPLQGLPLEDVESGTWEGRDFVLGWNRSLPRLRPVVGPMTVWIRFPSDVPSITHRFDLTYRIPALLDSFAIEVVGYRVGNLDPSSAPDRARSFQSRSVDPVRDPATGALVEILDARITSDLGRARPAGVSWADQRASNILGLIDPVRNCLLERVKSCTTPTSAATVDAARRALSHAQSLSEPLRAWLEPGCRQRLADELDRLASSRSGAARQALLTEARGIVEPVALASPETCGAPTAAWLFARILMRSRPDPGAPDSLSRQRNRCVAEIRRICDGDPDAPVRRLTEVRRRELPDYFDRIWRPRAVMPHSPGDKSVVSVTTFLPAGGSPVELTAMAAVGSLARWSSDGATVLVERRDPAAGGEIWSLSSDGASIERKTLQDLPDCAGPVRGLTRGVQTGLITPDFQTEAGVRSYVVGSPRGGSVSRRLVRDLCHLGELDGAEGERSALHADGEILHLLYFPGASREGGDRVPDGQLVHERIDLREGRSGAPVTLSIGELARFAGSARAGAFFDEAGATRLALLTTQPGGRPAISTIDLDADRFLDLAFFPGGVADDPGANLRWLPGTGELLALVNGRLFRASVRAGVTGRVTEVPGVPASARWVSLGSGPGTVVVLGGSREDGPLAGLDLSTGTSWPLTGPGTPFAGGRLGDQPVEFSPELEEARP